MSSFPSPPHHPQLLADGRATRTRETVRGYIPPTRARVWHNLLYFTPVTNFLPLCYAYCVSSLPPLRVEPLASAAWLSREGERTPAACFRCWAVVANERGSPPSWCAQTITFPALPISLIVSFVVCVRARGSLARQRRSRRICHLSLPASGAMRSRGTRWCVTV